MDFADYIVKTTISIYYKTLKVYDIVSDNKQQIWFFNYFILYEICNIIVNVQLMIPVKFS